MEAPWAFVRQDVDQEAADEFIRCERHDLLPVAVPMGRWDPGVFPLEGDAFFVAGDQATVCDGDAVRVAAKIGEYRVGPGERTLGVSATGLEALV